MKLSEFRSYLSADQPVRFKLPGGSYVPAHFHITEAGLVTKHFIDCGGTIREESAMTMQIWTDNDYDHRLQAGTLAGILDKAEPLLKENDLDIEMEYQIPDGTIGKYGVEFDGTDFQLTQKMTDCLAKEKCGVSETKRPVAAVNACSPGSGCC
ncbi:MAG: hypothetical protein GVY08_01470 [Bacteroidetes bacterium]|jgi:hypothetical protein|nr:hypothetical protein [Bacteroidota bacterium]